MKEMKKLEGGDGEVEGFGLWDFCIYGERIERGRESREREN